MNDSAASGLRFTERGAECRRAHVKGYTGPICSCGPMECKAVREHSENEKFDPATKRAQGEPLSVYLERLASILRLG